VLKAPLYSDVVPRLKTWKEQGRRLAIFSSGSVEAQHLFLGHTGTVGGEKEVGKVSVNVRGLFMGNFDTVNAGPKMDAKSYEIIAEELNEKLNHVLFLSDNVKEVRAAQIAGMESLVVDRPGNAKLSEEDKNELTVITSLDEIDLD